MSERPTSSKAAAWPATWVTAVLAVSAALTIGYWSVKALGEADTEAMESPLMLSVARQLVVGPGELYGPFGGGNPLVLIHAPLYYRCAALVAWPMARAGLHPVTAARIAGRLLSAAGLLATMAAAYRLGRLGGRPTRSGRWAALLVASSPVLAGQPFAVRPDMAGVALQSWGAVLVLEAMASRTARGLFTASVLFGLSACVKQHLLGAWAASSAIVAANWARGRVGPGAVTRAVLPGLAVVGVVYGSEWLVTGGRVWEAAFVAAANVGRVHPGDWDHVFVVCLGMVNASAGILAMLCAGALVAAGSRTGPARGILGGAGVLAIGLVLTASVVQLIQATSQTGAALFFVSVLALVVALLAAAPSLLRASSASANDAALWAYLVVELGLMTLLSRMSTGAWLNYAIPATVFAAALAGRALAHAVDAGPPLPAALTAALAALALLASSLHGLRENERRTYVERAMVDRIDEHLRKPRPCEFFTDRPGLNRLNGRLELVHDDWLYPVFESLGLAESRSRWLGPPLASGPVRAVITTDPRPAIEGTTLDLRRLGYRPDARLGPFFVWIR